MEITLIGLGYVGLPVACSFAKAGVIVNGIDTNTNIIDNLKLKKYQYTEKNLNKILDETLNKSLFVHNKIVPSDTYIVTVQTPLNEDKSPDLSYIEKVYCDLSKYIKNNDLVILESTVPVGANEYLYNILRKNVKSDIHFEYCYCPESILPGNIFYEIAHNDRVLGGKTLKASKRAEKIYDLINVTPKELTDIKTAEFVKLIQNSHRDVELAFVNQISMMCDEENVDAFKVIKVAKKHPRCNLLQPGSGVGGHCIAVDPYFLLDKFKDKATLIATARKINDYKPIYIANKAIEIINKDKSKIIGVLGLSYKADCEDCRESSGISICNYLKSNQYKILANEINSSFAMIDNIINSSIEEVVDKSDVIIIAQKHKQYSKIDFKNKKIIDAVNLLG